MRKPDFCLYKCDNEIADQMCVNRVDQMRGNCAADKRLCLRYRDSTSPLNPYCQTPSHLLRPYMIFRDAAYNSIIIISNPFKRAYQLLDSAGMGRLGWVMTSH